MKEILRLCAAAVLIVVVGCSKVGVAADNHGEASDLTTESGDGYEIS